MGVWRNSDLFGSEDRKVPSRPQDWSRWKRWCSSVAHVASRRVRLKKIKGGVEFRVSRFSNSRRLIFLRRFGPMLGQYAHFSSYYHEKLPYPIERYTKEANRLFKVLDTQLAKHKYVSASGYPLTHVSSWIILDNSYFLHCWYCYLPLGCRSCLEANRNQRPRER